MDMKCCWWFCCCCCCCCCCCVLCVCVYGFMFHIVPPSHIRALHTLTHLSSPISHGFSVCIVSCSDRMGHSHCYAIHPTPASIAGDWDTIQPYLHHVFCLVCIRLSSERMSRFLTYMLHKLKWQCSNTLRMLKIESFFSFPDNVLLNCKKEKKLRIPVVLFYFIVK